MLNSISKIILIFFLSFILYSCSHTYHQTNLENGSDGKYLGLFPHRNDSKQLSEISNSIQRVSCLALYEVYSFKDNSNLKTVDVNDSTIKADLVNKSSMDKSNSGTATIIYSDNGKVGLLTCAHVIDFQDTIITFFSNGNGTYSDKVASIAFKKKLFIYIAGFPLGSNVNLIFMDKSSDIALLGQDYPSKYFFDFPILSCNYGQAKKLDLANFVYSIGFPLNYKMVSQAIVSRPNYDGNGSFFIDAVINPGFSGGPVLAINNETSKLELVGIVDWVAEENQNIVEPFSQNEGTIYDPHTPYKSDLYIKQLKTIKYGITKIISIEEIESFLRNNKSYFINAGYNFQNY